MTLTRPAIFGLPVNASILRFNAIWPVLTHHTRANT